MSEDRPRFRVSADRQSASRRVRYVESSKPDDGQCTLCQLDELADLEAMRAERNRVSKSKGNTNRD
ncbi:hypothetical protein [Pseudomonas sp.]|uniref:hypothetical protein n=1 Tax=Pseudomonas sp. TaxID=306 RepID=UPI0027295848|nr:hypothetical protein [Pseudomonas sp.]